MRFGAPTQKKGYASLRALSVVLVARSWRLLDLSTSSHMFVFKCAKCKSATNLCSERTERRRLCISLLRIPPAANVYTTRETLLYSRQSQPTGTGSSITVACFARRVCVSLCQRAHTMGPYAGRGKCVFACRLHGRDTVFTT